MVDTPPENSSLEDLPLVAVSDEKADPNSSEVLDLSIQPFRPAKVPRPCHILNSASQISLSETDQQQLMRQPSVNSAPSMPLSLRMEIDIPKFTEDQQLSQKKKEQADNDRKINYYQINNVQINGQINNDRVRNSQINFDQINVNKILHEPLKNGQIDRNYINANQVIAKDINSNTNLSNLLSIEQPVLQQHSIPMGKPTLQYSMPTNNMSMPNAHSLPLPVTAMTMEDIEKSTILTSIAKAPRPFKVYPKNPLALSTANKDTSDAYNTFRNHVLQYVKQTEKEGTNNKMRRISNRSNSPMSTDDNKEKTLAYLEKRKKNNAAAKRSRDARRAKEDELAIRATFLERENYSLRSMLNLIVKQLQDQKVQFDFRPLIEMHENAFDKGTVHSSS